MRFGLLTTSLATVLFAITTAQAQIGWNHAKVFVPTDKSLSKLLDSNLITAECVNHLGWNDVYLGQSDWLTLAKLRLKYEVIKPVPDPTKWPQKSSESADFRNEYFDADQIIQFFEDLRADNPSLVSRVLIGQTINGEDMYIYKFADPRNSRNARNVMFQTLVHAREWITGSCSMYIADRIVDRLIDPTSDRLLGNTNVWILPIANPDGYRYTWTNNRFWRKNRRNNPGSSFGVDLNRNYSTDWGGSGASGNPSSQTYRGTGPFSEPETAAVRDFVASIGGMDAYIDIHSYSQLVLLPWGYTTSPPPNQSFYQTWGNNMANSLSGFGETYVSGQCSIILYEVSGGTFDYFLDTYGTKAISWEMRDDGTFGFDLPADQISVSQDEAWAGFQTFLSGSR